MSSICIVLPNLAGGGAEKLSVNLANSWVDSGHNVEFILMNKQNDFSSIISNKIKITILSVSRISGIIIPLRMHITKERPDIILSAMWPMTSASVVSWLLSGKIGKLFLSDHNMLSISAKNNPNISYLFLSILMKLTYKFASGVIAVSKGVKHDICNLSLLSDNRIKVIYNPIATGLNTPDFSKDAIINVWGEEVQHRVLSVGSLIEQKDHETLIKAISLLSDIGNLKLVILGKGHLYNKLESLIEKYKLQNRVELAGFVSNPDKWFSSADLFVLSSRWEGFGNVIVESLEYGTPVVSTDCPSGPSEILNDGTYGKLVQVGDIVELADAIRQGLHDIHDIDFLKARAKDFSIDKISRQYLNYFESK
jgi:glycosyltransferase involved in cell wall biosynthesis